MHSKYKLSAFVPVVAFFAFGCSVEQLDPEAAEAAEDVGSIDQAFSTAECASLGASITVSGGFWNESPRSYNKCFKGFIADLTDYAGNNYYNAGTTVEWNDTLPTTQAACEATWMAAIIYETTPSGNVGLDIRNSNGVWSQWFGNGAFYCAGPSVRFDDLLQPGGNYRVAVTARTAQTSAAATRSVFFASQKLW